ncbi:MAG: hypothetical protein K2X87_05505 [Gemmataceae bacterium]|nr:hypothetical protein [Gemmataceae bacterium]
MLVLQQVLPGGRRPRGGRFVCSCGHRAMAPWRPGGYSRARTLADWLVEVLVYGRCGAALGFGLGVLILSRLPVLRRAEELVLGLTVLGLVAGAVFGEAGINWVGRRIRAREEA